MTNPCSRKIPVGPVELLTGNRPKCDAALAAAVEAAPTDVPTPKYTWRDAFGCSPRTESPLPRNDASTLASEHDDDLAIIEAANGIGDTVTLSPISAIEMSNPKAPTVYVARALIRVGKGKAYWGIDEGPTPERAVSNLRSGCHEILSKIKTYQLDGD